MKYQSSLQFENYLTFGIQKLDNYIILKNVDFFNRRDGIHPDPLQGALKPFIICRGGLMNSLLLSAVETTK